MEPEHNAHAPSHALVRTDIRELLDRIELFVRLCNRLYDDLDEPGGGPLHCQLEDHNLDHLLDYPDQRFASDSLVRLREARARIDLRERGSTELGDTVDNLVYHYRLNPEAIKTTIDILEITRRFSENEMDAAYLLWLASRGERYCCRVAPPSQVPGNPNSNLCCDSCCPDSHYGDE